MTTHTDHEDTHTHGLADDCLRCQEYVRDPLGLDSTNIRRLFAGEIHTTTDAIVAGKLKDARWTGQYLDAILDRERQ